MRRYNPKEIEPKWQQIWDEQQVYKVDLHSSKPKYIGMSMFNYPSGAGIHIGHAMTYTISDVKARFKRQLGHESYHPVGWDAFGLPAENYAIKAGVSPQASMATIIPGYHKQYKAMGWSNDWSKEIATHEPEYYKWTQWIFTQMYKHGLAYQDARLQWWCDIDKTVLANEQIVDGKCWRHDGPDDPIVEQREVKQWFFKITEYADELLDAIDDLDWTESVKLAQKNWIGRSIGAEVDFGIEGSADQVKVFTTRIDTIFGATFIVLAPEHELVSKITVADQKKAVDEYVKLTQKKTEVERQANKEKTGVFTGAYAVNPANGNKIPVWIADYVLTGYGTGAIMAVPAHDERDHEFAETFNLPIEQVVAPEILDQINPVREGEKNTDRNVAMCVIEHPEDGSFLTLKWNKYDWHNLVMGGVEEGEDVLETAKREITEETGYTDIDYVETMPLVINSKFFALHKNVNRNILTTVLRFKLKSLAQIDTQREAHEDFEPLWVAKKALAELQPISELPYILDWLDGKLEPYTGEGVLVNSGEFTGSNSAEAREKIINWLVEKGSATSKTNYKMRDWSVSRQRYWGAPIPIVHCPKCGIVPIPEEQLPVILPELTDFAPTGDGRSALARATDWLMVDCPNCGSEAERETDTLDTYICSSWYMLRYMDPHNQEKIFDTDLVNKWAPVDFYNGADHATAHLLYARFVTRFFVKLGLLVDPEPFKQMLFNGKVLASDGSFFSKSKGNGVDPLEIIDSGYGADALRTYLMFAAPLELGARWDPQGVPGTYRFLNRVWTLVQEYLESPAGETPEEVAKKLQHATHQMIGKMSEDLNESRYNTAIAAAMANVNELYKIKTVRLVQDSSWKDALEAVISCIAPFAPHVAEELWQQLGHETSVHIDSWPEFKAEYLQTDEMTLAVQINGKVRAEIQVSSGADKDTIIHTATQNERIAELIADKEIRKTIYVPNKLVNIVV